MCKTERRPVMLMHRANEGQNVPCPWSSTFEKQLSVILRRSSSKRSARDMPVDGALELVVEGGPLAPPVGGRFAGARGSRSPIPLG